MEIFYIFIMVAVTQLHVIVEICQTCELENMDFIVLNYTSGNYLERTRIKEERNK